MVEHIRKWWCKRFHGTPLRLGGGEYVHEVCAVCRTLRTYRVWHVRANGRGCNGLAGRVA